MKVPISQNNFVWQTPTQGVLYTVGYLTVPANATWRIDQGSPFLLMLPVYEETTADGSGNFSINLKKFIESNYWTANQLIYVVDVSTGNPLNFTYSNGTVSGSGATANGTVRVYYIPFDVEIRVEARFQTPDGRKTKTIWMGDTGHFVYQDLGKDKVRFEASADLARSDQVLIKARSDDSSVKVDPYLPDGHTLVPILRTKFYVEQLSTSVG